jgi:hypothetical protein
MMKCKAKGKEREKIEEGQVKERGRKGEESKVREERQGKTLKRK